MDMFCQGLDEVVSSRHTHIEEIEEMHGQDGKKSESIIADILHIISQKDGFPHTFIDVGANKNASVSRPFIENGWTCLLIEPQKNCVDILFNEFRNFAHVSIERCGCSDVSGVSKLFHGKDGAESELSTFSSSKDPWMNEVRDLNNFENVPVYRLSDLIDRFPEFGDIGILKIDTESFDYKVLLGINFDFHKPKVIVTEEYFWNIDDHIGKHKLLEDVGYINVGWIEYNTVWVLGKYYDVCWSHFRLGRWLRDINRLPSPFDRILGVHEPDILLSRTRAHDRLLDDLDLMGSLRPYSCEAGRTTQVCIVVANMGDKIVPCQASLDSDNRLLVSYHWFAADGTPVIWDGLRACLSQDIEPHAAIVMELPIEAPPISGIFELKIDFVIEGVGWLSARLDCCSGCQVAVH